MDTDKEKTCICSSGLCTQRIHGVKETLELTAVPVVCKFVIAPDNDRGAQTSRLRGQRVKLVPVKLLLQNLVSVNTIGVSLCSFRESPSAV